MSVLTAVQGETSTNCDRLRVVHTKKFEYNKEYNRLGVERGNTNESSNYYSRYIGV